ncbi:MAG: ABC transporter transmembrane domain-containing protein, partial [Clostridia bacterium]|nr:ABC transporter transmembrane domain-containing protein [Clostridia bacterium]
MDSLLINKAAPESFGELLKPYEREDEPFLFAIVGDLTLKQEYGQTAVVVTKERFFVLDFSDNTVKEYKISDVASTRIKRMYSNAYMEITKKDGGKEVVARFTFAVAGLMDMASTFIKNMAAGNSFEDEMRTVEGTYEKLMCVCPKCGRTLLRPGADCIKCQSKSKVLGKFFKYIKPEIPVLICCFIISMLLIVIELLPPLTSKMIIDDILPNQKRGMLWAIVVFMFFAYIVHYGMAAFSSFLLSKCGTKIVSRLRNDVYEKAQHLPMKFYDKTPTGHVINRIGGDTSTIQSFMLTMTQTALQQILLFLGIMVTMLIMNWRLTLISLIPVPFVVWCGRAFGKKVAPYYRRIWRKWASVTSILTDSIPCIRVVKAFAGEKRAVNKFVKYNDEWATTNITASKITSVYPQLMGFLITIGTLAIWAFGGNWVIDVETGVADWNLTAG